MQTPRTTPPGLSDSTQYADRNVNVMAGRASRASLYVGSDADAPVAFWVAPTIDVGRRWFHDVNGQFAEPLAAPGVLCGLSFAWSRSVRQQFEVGLLVPAAGAGRVADGTGDQLSTQTRLGPGDVRFELNMAFLFGAHEP